MSKAEVLDAMFAGFDIATVMPSGTPCVDSAVEPFDSLTETQRQNLILTSEGFGIVEIAAACNKAVGTIKNARYHTMRRLNVENMPHVMRLACEIDFFGEPLEQTPVPAGSVSNLTIMEFDLLSRGLREKTIAYDLGRKRTAVSNILMRGRRAIGARTNEHAIRILFESGLIR